MYVHYYAEIETEYPTNLRASTVQSTRITFSWDRKERHSKLGVVTGYVIQFIDVGSGMSKLRVVEDQELTAYTFMELQPCSTYKLRVAAIFNQSHAGWSPAVEATTSYGGKGLSMYKCNTYVCKLTNHAYTHKEVHTRVLVILAKLSHGVEYG